MRHRLLKGNTLKIHENTLKYMKMPILAIQNRCQMAFACRLRRLALQRAMLWGDASLHGRGDRLEG